jgi:hypothetical protein
MPCRSSSRSWLPVVDGGSGASHHCLRLGIRPDLRSLLATVNFGSRASLIDAGDGAPQPIRTWGEWTWPH